MSKSANMSASEKTRIIFKNGGIHHVKRSSCKGIEKQYVRYSRSSQKKAETNGWAKKNTAAVMVQSRMGSFPQGEKLRKLNEKCDAEGKQERAAEGLAGIPEQGEK